MTETERGSISFCPSCGVANYFELLGETSRKEHIYECKNCALRFLIEDVTKRVTVKVELT